MTEEITIHIRSNGNCHVVNEVLPRARLYWHACGLNIYVRGHMPLSIYDHVCHVALCETINRHIPAISLKRVVSISSEQNKFNRKDDDL